MIRIINLGLFQSQFIQKMFSGLDDAKSRWSSCLSLSSSQLEESNFVSYIKKRKHSSLCRQPILTSLASGAGLGAAVLAGLTGQAVAQRVPDNTVIVQNESSMEDELAESKSQEDTFRLPTTHVTGSWQGYLKDYMADSKFAIPVSETPKTIQVIDENLLDDQQARSLTEALRNSPEIGRASCRESVYSVLWDEERDRKRSGLDDEE